MRKNSRLSGLAAVLVIAAGLASTVGISSARAATCQPTGFIRDSHDLTAALIDPAAPVTGTVDATGCNIGVYFSAGHSGTVKGATVKNASYYGIVNDGGSVSVSNSTVTNIGEIPFDGTQHGVGIYWAYNSGATGTIKNNVVTQYQKGGITVNGFGSSAAISGNTVTGLGPVDFIAQNGIQIGFGATGSISNNKVSGNEYTGTNYASSGGILVVGGPFYGDPVSSGISISNNTVTNNDVGVWLSNAETDGSPSVASTNNLVFNNMIAKTDGLTNVSGDTSPPSTPTCGYQAGVADEGNQDSIVNNKVSGSGYVPGSVCIGGTGTFSTAYDLLGTNHQKNNK